MSGYLPCERCGFVYAPSFPARWTGAAARRCENCGQVCAAWDDDDLTPCELATDDLADMVRGYVECALWSTTDDDDDPLDDWATISDVAAETLAAMVADCADFATGETLADLESLAQSGAADWGRHGHDFWLTRNGHGAGFWDRGYGEAGDRLAAAAKVYGESDLYRGDDGKVYA